MAVKRALVNYNGIIKELLDGDTLYGSSGGELGLIPAWVSTGEQSNISLTSENKIPAWLSDGSQSDISLVGG